MSSFHFTVRINSQSFPWTIRSVQETYLPKFSATSDVQYCILKPIVHTSQCWCCLATDICKKRRLKLKLKISNAADIADITQSQARDTRHRRMQEVNNLCSDIGPLRANTVLCHSTQYRFLVCRLSRDSLAMFKTVSPKAALLISAVRL